MSMLGLSNYEYGYSVNESVNLFDGSVEKLMEESMMAIHGVFEAMYDLDCAENSYVYESIGSYDSYENEYVFESAFKDKLKSIKKALKHAVDVVVSAVMKVINGAIDFFKKLKKTNAQWLESATKGKTANSQSAKIKGYNFPDMGAVSSENIGRGLMVALQSFNAKCGAPGARSFAVKHGDNAMKVFNENKEAGIASALGDLCGKESVKPAEFKKAAHEAAFGGSEATEIEFSLSKAENMLLSEIDKELSALKEAKKNAKKAFEGFVKDIESLDKAAAGAEGEDSSKFGNVCKAFLSAYGTIKTYYISRLKIGISAANAAASQAKKVVSKCYGKSKGNKKEEENKEN